MNNTGHDVLPSHRKGELLRAYPRDGGSSRLTGYPAEPVLFQPFYQPIFAEKYWCATGTATTQCRSNPVSGRGLPKTGIFQIFAGDYRRFIAGSGQIWSLETNDQFTKARCWRALLRLLRTASLSAGLPGWRRSGIRTSLHTNSLLTGNFTGIFANSGPMTGSAPARNA